MVSNEQRMLKERIQALLHRKNYSVIKLADNSDTDRMRYGRQINGNSVVSVDTVQKVLLTFPDVDANWLLMGEAPIFRSDHHMTRVYNTEYVNKVSDNASQFGPVNMGKDTTQVIRDREIEERERTIAELRKRVEELERDKKMNQGIIEAFIYGKKQ